LKRALKVLGWACGLLLLAAVALAAAHWQPDRGVEELAARWAQPPSRFLEVAGMRVHLRDEGPRDDPAPIVLLHGTASSLHTWDGWAAALAPARRVIRYDMPAFGLTGPEPRGDYTIEGYVRVLVAVLDHLGVARCVLAGNSLGGYIAWAAAVLHPGRIERLVLVDAGGYPYRSTSVPIAFRLARLPVIGPLTTPLLPRRIVESSVRNVFGDPSKVTPELVDRYFDMATRAGNRQALVERFRQTQPGALAQRVPELKLPTLILWGARDRLIPPEQGERFHREIAGSTLVVYDDLGHVPQEEDPARTAAAVARFLGTPPAPQASR
jgi:pimeloyl-ACP methyl ester carboxylesterase